MENQPEAIQDEPTFQTDLAPTANDVLTEPFTWQAPEGTKVNRGMGWYAVFSAVVVVMIILAIFVFKSPTFAILLPVMAVAVILLSSKDPRTINYAISPKGIYIADKLYDFSEFRAFGIIQEPDLPSIIVLPVKRFSPGLTLYFHEQEGERVVDMLGARLPVQEVKPDSLEKLIRLIRL